MAKPRVFISSTYYDLKYLRSSLENLIESLGYEPVLSEKGNIAYISDSPLDESCYREVSRSDIFVLIIGGRYGFEASNEKRKLDRDFFERYDSITKQEYANAVSNNIPIYILIENNVYSEYKTFLHNKGNKAIHYAHVDSINVFSLIEHILSQPRNNPLRIFERFSDIEGWIKDQWAGLFKELLHRLSNQQQIATLSSKIAELGNVNKTLKRYLEEIVSKISPDKSTQLINFEDKRLDKAKQIYQQLMSIGIMRDLIMRHSIEIDDLYAALTSAESINDFTNKLKEASGRDWLADFLDDWFRNPSLRQDLNNARKIFGLSEIK